jgi:D-glycero-alpha-D-manno-heptose-7-phosphate kinase
VLKFLSIDRGLEIHHDGDLPARSGMGSSSAFTVGLLNALYALKGQMPSKRQLANESIGIEQDRLKESVGSQDQVMAAYGGVRHVRFTPHGEIIARPLTVSHERIAHLNEHLMLFYTGIKRTASDIAETYITNIDLRRRQLRLMKELVEEGISILNSGNDLMEFGNLLHEAWQAKRSLSGKVSNPQVDGLMDQAMKAGALGGKLTGAGGGGFMLLFVPPELRGSVAAALPNLIHVPFKFEFSGSQIIFFEPETDYSAEEQTRSQQRIDEFCELEKLRAA